MGNLIQTPHSEITATLEVLAKRGVTAEHWARPARHYIKKKNDIHEADPVYLESVAQVYRDLAAADPKWLAIKSVAAAQLRPPKELHAEIIAKLKAKNILP